MSETNKLILGVVIVVLALFGYFLYSTASQKIVNVKGQPTSISSGSSSSTPTYTILPPATVAPKVAECSEDITFASNGDSGPVQCSNGDLNVKEWQSLAALEPTVFKLGYDANVSQVQTALCNDVKANISNPIEVTVYQIAALYYGWNFNTNPTSVISNGTCVNVDD